MTKFSLILSALIVAATAACYAQDQPKEAKQEEPPKLEIPEITIVGKKAITLPFARKGEIFDVTSYTAPMPDSTLLGTPPSMSLLRGSLPRYQNEDRRWRLSADGLFGSFGTVQAKGIADYKGDTWGVTGDIGFGSSNGHTTNSSSSSLEMGADAHSIFRTDNNILKSFSGSAGLNYTHDSYGMFGITSSDVTRRNNVVGIDTRIGTLNREGSVLDLDVGAKFSSVKDAASSGDSSVSAVSPSIIASYGLPVRSFFVSSSFSYIASSLAYEHPAQTPSATNFNINASWAANARTHVALGALLAGGSDAAGNTVHLVMPSAMAEFLTDSTQRLTISYLPRLGIVPYDEQLGKIPYFARESRISAERRPVFLGSTLEFRTRKYSLAFDGSYAYYLEKEVIVSGNGDIHPEYPEASIVELGGRGTMRDDIAGNLSCGAKLSFARGRGLSTQLPMIPVFDLTAGAEREFGVVTGWTSIDFQTPKNTDLAGTQSIPSVVLMNLGARTIVAHRFLLGAEIRNLFNVKYDWWKDYAAPGIGFDLTAKVNIE